MSSRRHATGDTYDPADRISNAADGTPVTDEVLDQLEREAEDIDPADLSHAARRPGRPSLHGGEGESAQIRIRVPKALRDDLQSVAADQGESLSEVTRRILADGLSRRR